MSQIIEKEAVRPGIYKHWRGLECLVLGMATFVEKCPDVIDRNLGCVHLFAQERVEKQECIYLYQLQDGTFVYEAANSYGDVVIFAAGTCTSTILFFRTYDAFTETFSDGQRRYSWLGTLSELAVEA